MERILASAVELYGDDAGMVLPPAIAPFGCVVVIVQPQDAAQAEAAEKLAGELEAAGIDVLLDDRQERPGVKFKDSELIGIPARLTVGRGLAKGIVELLDRRRRAGSEVPVEKAVEAVQAILAREGGE